MIIPGIELWDEGRQEFVNLKSQVLQLEHSLVSLSKWESKWEKPFFSKEDMTVEESVDYVRCMTITQNVNPKIYDYIPAENMRQINEYISAPMTATWFSDKGKRSRANSEQVTAELIYYWMITLGIPFECQKWHLARLFTLIEVCGAKNQKPKKMSRREIMARNAALNEQRKKRLNTKG